MSSRTLRNLATLARRHAGRPDEAEDLLQEALLAAIEAGRTDLSSPETRRWMQGVMRNKARMTARTAARRRRRETQWSDTQQDETSPDPAASTANSAASGEVLASLPQSLQVTALLALNGCTREEIGWLLDLSDAALRQRISQLKRALLAMDAVNELAPAPSLNPAGPLAYGQIRQRLLAAARRGQALASHDPDGHTFLVTSSQNAVRRQHRDG
jgi:RNA polymerase sigma factor (sigma-70 family)